MSTLETPSPSSATDHDRLQFSSTKELIAAYRARSRLRADDIFFFITSLLILGLVYLGFEESYFSAGLVFAELPNRLVHIHAALFVGWIFLLLAQTSLVMVRRITWHIALGSISVVWLPLLLIFGFLTLFDSIRRQGVPIPPEIILVGDGEELLIFAALSIWGLLKRRTPASHKRLMTLGTMAMLGPGIDRLMRPFGIAGTIGLYVSVPLIIVVYDLVSRWKVHHTTVIGYLLIAAGMLTLLPVSSIPIWKEIVAQIRA